MDPLGQGRSGGRGLAGLRRLPGRQRPDRRRLLADGVGERQQRSPALVHPDGAGRRIRRAVVRRVRQRLRRPARHHRVLPVDAVDPLAPAGHRNAFDTKASRCRSTAGRDPPRAGTGVRRAPRHRRRQPDGPGRRYRPHRFAARARRLRPGPPQVPGRLGTGLLGGVTD